MLKRICVFAVLLLLVNHLSAFEVSVNTAVFRAHSSFYLEIYSKFEAAQLNWQEPETNANSSRARIEMLCTLEKSGTLMIAEKYHIESPATNELVDFWDIKRFALEPGAYILRLQYLDLNDPGDTLNIKRTVMVPMPEEQNYISDLLLFSAVGSMESDLPFQKQKFRFEPLAYNLVNAEANNFIFYTELYGLAEDFDEDMFVKYYIENKQAEGLERFSNTGYKKIHSDSTGFILIDFSMESFSSGNYILHFELNKKNKQMLASREIQFSVYNPLGDYRNSISSGASFESSFFQFMDEEELNYSLKAIFPRVGNNMTEILNYIVAADDLMPKRYFLFNFWSGISQDNMKENYDAYMNVARAVDNTYATNVGYGFETHRGHYFLKYGKPDDMIFEEDEPTAPPYEIWIYNYVEDTQQTNVRFLFYNPSLAHNDFVLLHSTCRGERNNPRWELDLYSDAYGEQPSNYIDNRSMPSNFHRNARKYFNDF